MLTRVHIYSIGDNKILASYAHGSAFLLVGTHFDDVNKPLIEREMKIMNVKTISTLFIPEWSEIYCGDGTTVGRLLGTLMPTHIILPDDNCQKQFAQRIQTYVRQYKSQNKFVDIQYTTNNGTLDTDAPNQSINNFTIITKCESNGNVLAHRFESNGKWCSINLKYCNFESSLLKSDVVLYSTYNRAIMTSLIEASQELNPNIAVRYISLSRESLIRLILTGRLKGMYQVSGNDVVVSREDNTIAYSYYFNHDNKLIINKRSYTP